MLTSRLIHRILLALGLCLALGAAQCVAVVPPPPGGGGYPPGGRYTQAEFSGYARCEDRRARNGGQGFLERGLGQCFACPRGFVRSSYDVRGRRACVRRGNRSQFAENLGEVGCRDRGEFRIRESCYQCPPGYRQADRNSTRCVLRR